MQKLTVYTDLDTVSEAYTLLDELGLSGLLLSKPLAVDAEDLLRKLLCFGQMKRFLSIITGVQAESLPKLSGKETGELLSSFFVALVSDWMSLASFVPPAEANPAQTQ